jgi:cupin fold WbuC family metalloprotein
VRPLNDEVIAADEDVLRIDSAGLNQLKDTAAANARRRIRICAHHDTSDPLHEMVIVHMEGVYVRPHKHIGKTESMHVIEGVADVVFFDDLGGVHEVIPMGEVGSGHAFYYRLASSRYHTLVVRSEFFIFHEVTNGPFHPEDTVFAPWAPEETDAAGLARFQERLAAAAAGGRQ